MKGNTISTPSLDGTILPGITRKSIIEVAIDLGYQVLNQFRSIIGTYIDLLLENIPTMYEKIYLTYVSTDKNVLSIVCLVTYREGAY